jgi:myo-inositol 2-dehydrogenase / D-chiro-inositol 1-dehydrogenase
MFKKLLSQSLRGSQGSLMQKLLFSFGESAPKAAKPLKVALLGLGRAGGFHMNSLQQLPGIELKWAMDIVPWKAEHFSEVMNCNGTLSFEETLEDPETDAIMISSPTDVHYGQITRALKAGKHVFTEKPLGSSLAQVDECFKLAKKMNKVLFVGFNRRFD